MPKVSVVMPIYNSERFLERTIRSVTDQTLEDIELILVDDGSTDGSGAICDRFAQDSDKIHVIHTPNGGSGVARNTGMALARGEYVSFVDSDDYALADMCETMYNEAVQHKADVVKYSLVSYSEAMLHVQPGVPLTWETVDKEGVLKNSPMPDQTISNRQFLSLLARQVLDATVHSLLVRRPLLDKVQFTLNGYLEDGMFNADLTQVAKVYRLIGAKLYLHLSHAGAGRQSAQLSLNKVLQSVHYLVRLFEYCEDMHLPMERKAVMRRLFEMMQQITSADLSRQPAEDVAMLTNVLEFIKQNAQDLEE